MRYKNIAIIGLGYVGLPLAMEFSKYFKVIGFDINKKRIFELRRKVDKNGEVKKKQFNNKNLYFTHDKKNLKSCNIFIIAVPTPVNSRNKPELKFINSATILVAKFLKRKNIVIYESTVYPGFTKEISIPILEKFSSLKLNSDFFCGYSPERINPGDNKRKLPNIEKLVSASNPYSLRIVNNLYKKIIKAKVISTSSIEIAESAKIIENCQRDINVAFINELFILFNKLNINFFEILDSAKTKWNFLNFVPGLVGGHCIGVDPYYLADKARRIGHNPKMILAGRNINNSMPKFYSRIILKKLKKPYQAKKILILGSTFKENCKDLRNSKVFDLYFEIKKFGCKVNIFDPLYKINYKLYNPKAIYNIKPKTKNYDAIILAVPHKYFEKKGLKKILKWGKKDCEFLDIKNSLIKYDSETI